MNSVSAILASIAATLGLGGSVPSGYSGYIEADYVYVAPQVAGTIDTIAVEDGAAVEKGAMLVALDAAGQQAALAAAEAQARAAQAEYDNLTTGGRAEEIEAARANLAKAQSDLALARSRAKRTEQLFAQGFASAAERDAAEAAVKSASAQVDQLTAQLALIRLPARTAQQRAAEANLAAAEANVRKARADLAERTLTAPASGRVERVYYQVGETAVAGVPILAIEPEGPRKVQFFVPEPDRSGLRLGQSFAVSCDGCPEGLTARLAYLAADPETTPPIIYSREERTRLVFMAEAEIARPEGLLPGQPVTVTPK